MLSEELDGGEGLREVHANHGTAHVVDLVGSCFEFVRLFAVGGKVEAEPLIRLTGWEELNLGTCALDIVEGHVIRVLVIDV